MSIVTGRMIQSYNGVGWLITPLDPRRVQPASIDLTLDRHFLEWRMPSTRGATLDLKSPSAHLMQPVDQCEYHLAPGNMVLCSTIERVAVHAKFVGRVEGKSSLGRLGLMVHVTAGFIDPGFDGQITLEVVNMSPYTLVLHAGMPVCQLSLESMSNRDTATYAGKYQGQRGPTASRFHENWNGKDWAS